MEYVCGERCTCPVRFRAGGRVGRGLEGLATYVVVFDFCRLHFVKLKRVLSSTRQLHTRYRHTRHTRSAQFSFPLSHTHHSSITQAPQRKSVSAPLPPSSAHASQPRASTSLCIPCHTLSLFHVEGVSHLHSRKQHESQFVHTRNKHTSNQSTHNTRHSTNKHTHQAFY